MVGRGIFNGVSETQFAPNGTMTRAMFATALARLAGERPGGAAGFSDVPAGAWYAAGVAWAAENGIVQGLGDGRFDPAGEITREQIALMLYNYAKYAKLGTAQAGDLARFADRGAVSPWAAEALAWAAGSGIVAGRPGNALDPGGTATRAEAAAMLERLIGRIG